jgi:hypothetical protein
VDYQEIVRDARSVVVAGGTMNPVEEFKQQLFIGEPCWSSLQRNTSSSGWRMPDLILSLLFLISQATIFIDL